jgi:SAM-dependent methyltransferase
MAPERSGEISDRLAREFDAWVADGRADRLEAGHAPFADPVFARMPTRAGSSILDLSCGTGWAARRLAHRAHRGKVWGTDLSPAMVERARRNPDNPPNVDFEVAPAEALPFSDGFFDIVFSMEAFYYFPDIPAALAECRRVLRAGGELDIVLNLYWENEPSRRWPALLDVPVKVLRAADWLSLCEAVGFSAVFEERIPDSSPVPRDFQPSRFFANAAELRKFRDQGALRIAAVR